MSSPFQDPLVLDDQEDDLSQSKRIQLRWRVAFRAICFIRILSLNKNSQHWSHLFTITSSPFQDPLVLDDQEEDLSRAKRIQLRWRVAFRAICFIRQILSLNKKVPDNNSQLLSHCRSHVAIHIEDDCHQAQHFHDVDKKLLSEMVAQKSFESLRRFGGVEGVAEILETNRDSGVRNNEADLQQRRNVFGANRYKKQPRKTFLSHILDVLKDETIIVLLGSALLSLWFGVKENGMRKGWYDGAGTIVAVFVVVIVSAVRNFKQDRVFNTHLDENRNIRVELVRDGRLLQDLIVNTVVGDVVILKNGYEIPADGLLLSGHSMMVDESSISMTEESEHVEIKEENPFLLSGTRVVDGHGFMLVTSVGMNTGWSHARNFCCTETPLQGRVKKLASNIGKIGFSLAVIVRVVKLILYLTGNSIDEMGNINGMVSVMENIAKSMLVVAISRSSPRAVAMTLAYFMERMRKEHVMVRKLSACETVASVQTICTDTGTLTLNQKIITECRLGLGKQDYLLQEAVVLNTFGNAGSPTEKALLSWALNEASVNVDEMKQNCKIIHVEAFNLENKKSGISMRRNHKKGVHIHWKGAADVILPMCSSYHDGSGTIKSMDDQERMKIRTIIKKIEENGSTCIAFAHKKVEEDCRNVSDKKLEETGLTYLGLVGLKDPGRPDIRRAVESCKNAGVKIKMITGDNVHTARAIAIECGILNLDEGLGSEAVVEGIQFRNYTTEERMAKIENIRVMARSSSFDKLLMVQCLKQKGHVVAVTGDGTNDAPALKEADIGLSMGIQGTEVTKESSDVVILDDNFASVVKVLRWGRCVYNNIQKFLQFQLTVNVAALVINFDGVLSSSEVPFKAVHFLWVKLIMDTLGALALATEPPTDDLMKMPPVDRSQPLITRTMWRNLIPQVVFQVATLLTLQFWGTSVFPVSENVKNTVIFNTFVFCQVFNVFNCRKLEKKNIFEGIHKNKLFLVISGIIIAIQIVMVEFLNTFAHTERLNGVQWAVSIGIAALSWPIGVLFKCISVSGNQLLRRGASAS